MPYIELSGISKSYTSPGQGEVEVLDHFDLSIEKGEFVSVFGPNGCGKSTLLNLVADLTPCETGLIRIDGKPPNKSRIGYVFQKYGESLFPWMRNIDNIGISLGGTHKGRRRKREAVREFVDEMGLQGVPLESYPYQCSAGQQQVVVLLRELMYQPDVLLMDEPFVALDYDRRLAQQEHLLRSYERTGATVLFVSHEIDEAIYLADRLLLLSQRPARLIESYEIELPRPRTLDMLESEDFFRLKTPILQAFRGVIGK